MKIYVQKTKIMYTFLVFILFTFASCASNRPVATTHTERIEERVMPVAVGADTIIIESVFSAGEATASSVLSVGSVREKENSVRDKNISVRNTNSMRIKSTRGVNISQCETDTTSTLRITLRPDTVFVPYINHIRSDTIVVPDRVCQQKLIRLNMTNLFLILILIAMLMLAVRRAKLV